MDDCLHGAWVRLRAVQPLGIPRLTNIQFLRYLGPVPPHRSNDSPAVSATLHADDLGIEHRICAIEPPTIDAGTGPSRELADPLTTAGAGDAAPLRGRDRTGPRSSGGACLAMRWAAKRWLPPERLHVRGALLTLGFDRAAFDHGGRWVKSFALKDFTPAVKPRSAEPPGLPSADDAVPLRASGR